MPYYEYRCGANGQTVEVRHGMDERLETWGELVGRAGADPGDTAADEPVERLMSAPVALTGSGADQRPESGFQGCGAGCACAN
jgi:predicted nucleic acid-binding Zn ribbon protein